MLDVLQNRAAEARLECHSARHNEEDTSKTTSGWGLDVILCHMWLGGAHGGSAGVVDRDERSAALSAAGDPLERLAAVVDFERFRGELEAALDRSDRAKGGRPPYDAVLMFKVLVLQTLSTLADDQTEYPIRDRLSFMRFLGLALEDRTPRPSGCFASS